MEYEEIGEMLEHKGLSDDEIDDFMEHHGVKGQKWGVRRAAKRSEKGPDRFGNRNNASTQRRVDRVSRVASGTASRGDKAKAILLNLDLTQTLREGSLRGGAQAQLEHLQKIKNKTEKGKKNTTDILRRIGGVDVRELNFSFTPGA